MRPATSLPALEPSDGNQAAPLPKDVVDLFRAYVRADLTYKARELESVQVQAHDLQAYLSNLRTILAHLDGPRAVRPARRVSTRKQTHAIPVDAHRLALVRRQLAALGYQSRDGEK